VLPDDVFLHLPDEVLDALNNKRLVEIAVFTGKAFICVCLLGQICERPCHVSKRWRIGAFTEVLGRQVLADQRVHICGLRPLRHSVAAQNPAFRGIGITGEEENQATDEGQK